MGPRWGSRELSGLRYRLGGGKVSLYLTYRLVPALPEVAEGVGQHNDGGIYISPFLGQKLAEIEARTAPRGGVHPHGTALRGAPPRGRD